MGLKWIQIFIDELKLCKFQNYSSFSENSVDTCLPR